KIFRKLGRAIDQSLDCCSSRVRKIEVSPKLLKIHNEDRYALCNVFMNFSREIPTFVFLRLNQSAAEALDRVFRLLASCDVNDLSDEVLQCPIRVTSQRRCLLRPYHVAILMQIAALYSIELVSVFNCLV